MKIAFSQKPCHHCGRLFMVRGEDMDTCSRSCPKTQWFVGEPTVPGSELDAERRNALVRQWLGYAWKMAVKVYRCNPLARRNLEVVDLYQHGVIGLVTAARRFDPGRETKFITYAHYWVRRFVYKVVAESTLVRIPADLTYARVEDGNPDDPFWLERTRKAKAARRTTSITGWRDDDSRPFDHPAPESVPPGDDMDRQALSVRTTAAIGHLDPKRRTVIVERFGLGGGPPLTLDEVGKKLGLTRERVRQLEMSAFDALRGWLADGVRPETAEPCRYSRGKEKCNRPATVDGYCNFHHPLGRLERLRETMDGMYDEAEANGDPERWSQFARMEWRERNLMGLVEAARATDQTGQ